MKRKKKELIKNTIIIFLGKFCTQFISFLLVPIYTYYLSTSDYGYVDLVQSYVALLAPLLILRFDSAIFRFLIDERENKIKQNHIINNSLLLLFVQSILFTVICLLLNQFVEIKYVYFIIICVISVSTSNLLLQLTRGLGDNLGYSIASVICGVTTVLLNSILIIIFKWNADSILLSTIIGNLLASIYLIIKNKIYKIIIHFSTDKKIFVKKIKYSIPMIFDGLSWWIVNVSDRSLISLLLGTSFNGIYAISTKFSNILQGLFGVFNMTWQESASLHIDEPDRDEFFSSVFNNTISFFSTISIIVMIIIPFIFLIMVGENYYSAYLYIPILLIGNVFNALSNVLGAVYIAKKETKKAAKTTIFCAITNLMVNLLLIKSIGLWAAAISTFLSYIVLFIYRYIDTKKYVAFKANYNLLKKYIPLILICSILYYINNIYLNVFNIIITISLLIIINMDYLKKISKRIKIRR